jgi:hypothetical protein
MDLKTNILPTFHGTKYLTFVDIVVRLVALTVSEDDKTDAVELL